MSKPKRKIRPSTASGVIQSARTPGILDDLRPITAIGNVKEPVLGLEPTYLTADRQIGFNLNNKYTGKQVHGGVDENSLKDNISRRATIGPVENIASIKTLQDKLQRPVTAPNSSNNIKIEERITLDHLNKIKQVFEEADEDSTGTLDLEEFKNVFKHFLGLAGASDNQLTALFMKIDSSSNGEINWDEFCTYMQLEYAEKEESYYRAKETSFYLPATMVQSPHRDTVLSIAHTKDNTFLFIGQDGMVSFWTPNLSLKRIKQIESGNKKSKWIVDMILMPNYNKFIIATGDREIQFHELSTFEGYCQITGLETVPLRLDYCPTGPDQCVLMYGDAEGCISILLIKNVGQTLRLWKKMPKIEGLASIGFDSVCAEENVTFVRWKVHNDWVQGLKYYHSIRSVISCSTDSNYSMVIGQTLGSTHVYGISKDLKRTGNHMTSFKDLIVKRRLPADEAVFKIYKGVKCFDFSKAKNVIATGGMDRLIRLWNPYVPAKPIGILRGHVTPILDLFIVEGNSRLTSISHDKIIKIWDIHDQACLLTIRPKSHLIKGDITAVHYNPISRGLALATDHVAVLRLKNKPLSVQITTTHKEGVTCCCYNASFNHVVSASECSVVKVWGFECGQQVFEYSNLHDEMAITAMCFDSTGRRLVTAGQDGKMKIWNYNNGHCLSTLQPEDGSAELCCLAYFTINANRYIVSAGWDRRINLYCDTNDSLHHIQHPYIKWPDDIPSRAHKEDILSIAYTPPHFLASSSYDGEVLVWNVTSGRIFSRLRSKQLEGTSDKKLLEGDFTVSKILFLQSRCTERDAATLVANGPRGWIHFWNVFDPSEAYALFKSNTEHAVSFIETDEQNSFLITADVEGFVTVWDIEDYCIRSADNNPPSVLCSWRAHVQNITCITLVDSHEMLMTSSSDCTVRMWTMDGHFIGTYGQPKKWDVFDITSYQHPMAPYDVLMDPNSLPKHNILQNETESIIEDQDDLDKILTKKSNKDKISSLDDHDIKELLQTRFNDRQPSGKRLRHAQLKGTMTNSTLSGDAPFLNSPSPYNSLRCYELDEVPPVI